MFTNSSSLSNEVIKAQAHCLGHAIVWGAGPWSVDALYSISFVVNRPQNDPLVDQIYKLIQQGVKHDWEHPISAQIIQDQFRPEMLGTIKASSPTILESRHPQPLLAKCHTQEFIQMLGTLWMETNVDGTYLSPDELLQIKLSVQEQQKQLPPLVFLQGSQRLAALQRISKDIAPIRQDMINYGRSGDLEKFQESLLKVQDLILSSSFLIALYPDDMPTVSSHALSRNSIALPSSGPCFGAEVVYLRMQAKQLLAVDSPQIILKCSDTACLARDFYQMYPGSHSKAPISTIKVALCNPLVTQILVHQPAAIDLLNLAVGPCIPQMTSEATTYKAAYVWLSIEIFTKILQRNIPKTAQLDQLLANYGPETCDKIPMELAATIWDSAEDFLDADTPDMSAIYTKRFTYLNDTAIEASITPQVKDASARQACVMWNDPEVIKSCRRYFWRLGTSLQSWANGSAAHKSFGTSLLLYALLPLHSVESRSIRFIPGALLPSKAFITGLPAMNWFTELKMAKIMAVELLSSSQFQHTLQRAELDICHHYNMDSLTPGPGFESELERCGIFHLQKQCTSEFINNHVPALQGAYPTPMALEEGLKQDKVKLSLLIKNLSKDNPSIDEETFEKEFPVFGRILSAYTPVVNLWSWHESETESTRRFIAHTFRNHAIFYFYALTYLLPPLLEKVDGVKRIFKMAQDFAGKNLWWSNTDFKTMLEATLPAQQAELLHQHSPTTSRDQTPIQSSSSTVPNLLDEPGLVVEPEGTSGNDMVPCVPTPQTEGLAPPMEEQTIQAHNDGPSTENPIPTPPVQPSSTSVEGIGLEALKNVITQIHATGLSPPMNTSHSDDEYGDENVRATVGEDEESTEDGEYQPDPDQAEDGEDNEDDKDQEDEDMEQTSSNARVHSKLSKAKHHSLHKAHQDLSGRAANLSAQGTLPKAVRGSTSTQVVLHDIRPYHIATDNSLPSSLVHNLFAQSIGLRDHVGHTIPGGWKATVQALEDAAGIAEVIIAEMVEVRLWFIDALVKKVQLDISLGPELLVHSLGATVSFTRDTYLGRIAALLKVHLPNESMDSCINEAYRIAHTDGALEEDLVEWNKETGSITLNIAPALPLSIQDEHDHTHIYIGHAQYPSEEDDFFQFHQATFTLCTTGPSQSTASAPMFKNAGDWIAKKRMEWKHSHPSKLKNFGNASRMRGPQLSAISTGQFFGDGIVPRLEGLDEGHEKIQAYVTRLSQSMTQHFNEACRELIHKLPEYAQVTSQPPSEIIEEMPEVSQVMKSIDQGQALVGNKRKGKEIEMDDDDDDDAVTKKQRI
ncbi:hypothetical protein RhiTH_011692 [Rhizoctonia solani]